MTITEQVAERLAEIAPAVEERVVELLVDKEVSRRVELITQAIGKLDEFRREQRKLDKPDIETFDADSKPLVQSFSKERMEERKKLAEKADKLSRATDKAIGGDIGDLANVLKDKQ